MLSIPAAGAQDFAWTKSFRIGSIHAPENLLMLATGDSCIFVGGSLADSAFLMKLRTNGDSVWRKNYAYSGQKTLNALKSSGNEYRCLFGDKLVKVDSQGSVVRTIPVSLDGPASSTFYDVTESRNGDFYFLGTLLPTLLYRIDSSRNGVLYFLKNDHQTLLYCTDSSGNHRWHKQYPMCYRDTLHCPGNYQRSVGKMISPQQGGFSIYGTTVYDDTGDVSEPWFGLIDSAGNITAMEYSLLATLGCVLPTGGESFVHAYYGALQQRVEGMFVEKRTIGSQTPLWRCFFPVSLPYFCPETWMATRSGVGFTVHTWSFDRSYNYSVVLMTDSVGDSFHLWRFDSAWVTRSVQARDGSVIVAWASDSTASSPALLHVAKLVEIGGTRTPSRGASTFTPAKRKGVPVAFYTASGRLVRVAARNDGKNIALELKRMPAGVYIVVNSDGSACRKMIVQRRF